MNKKGQRRTDNGLGVAIIVFAVIAILVLYFLSKMFFIVGIGVAVISLVLIFFGLGYEEEQLVIIGLIGLVAGIILALIGYSGVSFFESNPTGKNLLDGANTAVNITKDTASAYSDVTSTVGSGVSNLKSIPVTHNIPPV